MDNIILGLLLMCNRTIYQLRDRISKGINLMYSSSMGSIQAAVKKLLNCGYISYEEIIDNGKYKKIYCITESGKLHFYEWINAPIEEQNPKIPELAKVYFMGFSDKKNRETSIQQHLMYLKESFNRFLIISLDVLICRYSPLFRAFPALFISEEPHKSFYYPLCFRSQK